MNDIQRKHVPGSKWLYYKIYVGKKTSDIILIKVLNPLIDELNKHKLINCWFYIRYSDPESHIRIRFLLKDSTKSFFIIQKMFNYTQKFIIQGYITKIQIDTYVRELERYGHRTMEISENLFCHESNMIIKLIAIESETSFVFERWKLGMILVDRLLTIFRYDINSKCKLLLRLQKAFSKEFVMDKILKQQLNQKYRQEKKHINNIMIDTWIISNLPLQIKEIDNWMNNISELVNIIIRKKDSGKLEIEFDNIIISYIHMLLNRLFRSKNRLYEMVLYYFLHSFYNSEIAKSRKKV